jgi:tetratricopeptide (TPR) repeat protein
VYVRALFVLVAAAWAISGLAHAGSKDIQYGAPPAWVAPAPAPTDAAAPEGAPVRLIYTDFQVRLTTAGDETYTAYKLKILTPEGLPVGNVAATWNPSTDDFVVHRLHLIRGGKVIDVLAKTKFQVIQRENNLENAMLDGELTATLQIPGVEVGDELEFAATIRRRETVFGDRSHGFAQLPIVGGPGANRFRLIWPDGKTIKWSATPDLGRLAVTDSKGAHELDYELRAPSSAVTTDGAPARVNVKRLIEYSEFKGWPELSALMAPLYDKASQLAADSPIRAEAAQIAKTHSDPVARAQAALQLVQDRVRYVYVGLDGGNYRPAAADDTWKRRFGDCKAKTAVLMALLRELGIQSEAVLVNSKGVDGADQRLPTPQLFDHVLVRASIGGKTYWLDGTRLGDKRLSPALQVPSLWVLPLRAADAKLETIPFEARTLPLVSSVVDIDATAGLKAPAKIFIEEVNRGDEAIQLKSALAALSRQDAERQLKAYWRQTESWTQPATVSWRYDDLQQAIILTMRGEGKLEWEGDDKDGHSLDVMGAGFSPPDELHRPAEQDQSAPWAVVSPTFKRWTTIIRLPPATANHQWVLYDDPVDLRLGGKVYHREAELAGGVVRSTMSIRAYLDEITPAQATELNDKLPTFNNKISKVYETNAQPEPNLADVEKTAGSDVQKLAALGSAYYLKSKWADADRVYAKALVGDPNNTSVRFYDAMSLANVGRFDDALKVLDGGKFDGAVALGVQFARVDLLIRAKRKDEGLAALDGLVRGHPGDKDVLFATAQALLDNGETERAVGELTDVIKMDPSASFALARRAQAFDRLGRDEEALRDLDTAVRLAPENSFSFMQRGVVLAKLGQNEEALGDLEEAWRINPMNGAVAETNAELLRKAGRPAEAFALFDAWVARDKTGTALNGRCWARALGNVELAAAEADCAKAVELAPKAGGFWDSYALVAVRDGRLPEAIKRYDKALELAPKQAVSLYGRGYAKIKSGDKAGGEADVAAAKAISAKAGQELIDAGLSVN